MPGHRYIDSHWLFQVLVYCSYLVAGLKGPTIFVAVVTLATFLVIAKHVQLREWPVSSSAFIALIILIANERFIIRPHIISLLFMGVYAYILERYRRRESRLIYCLPVLQLVWVNCHGEFAIGLFLIFATLLGELVKWKVRLPWTREEALRGSSYYRLAAIGAGCVVVCLLNPNLLQGARYPFTIYSEIGKTADRFMRTIAELKPTFSESPMVRTENVLFFKILLCLSILSLLLNWRRLDVTQLLIYVGFLHLSAVAKRNIAPFAVVVGPMTLLNLRRYYERSALRVGAGARIVAAAGLCVVMAFAVRDVVTDSYFVRNHDDRKFGFGVSEDVSPSEAINFIEKHELPNNVFTNASLGGYLLWRCYGHRRVFLDGRWEVYGREFLEDYLDLLVSPERWNRVADENQINCVLINYSSQETSRLLMTIYRDPRWRLVYFGDVHAVFLNAARRETAAFIRAHEIDLTLPHTGLSPRRPEPGRGRWLRRARLPVGHLNRGQFFLAITQYEKARQELEQAARVRPSLTQVWVDLGEAYVGMAEIGKAEELFKHALALDSNLDAAHVALGRLYHLIGLFAEAAREYGNCSEDCSPAHLGLGEALLALGQHPEAEQAYEKAIKTYPGMADAHAGIAQVYYRTDRREEAERSAKAALNADRDTPRAHVVLARLAQDRGRSSEAAQHCRAALGTTRDRVGAHLALAAMYRDLGQHAMALDRYLKALALDSRLLVPRFFVAQLYRVTGKPEKAREYYEDFVASSGDDAFYRDRALKELAELRGTSGAPGGE